MQIIMMKLFVTFLSPKRIIINHGSHLLNLFSQQGDLFTLLLFSLSALLYLLTQY